MSEKAAGAGVKETYVEDLFELFGEKVPETVKSNKIKAGSPEQAANVARGERLAHALTTYLERVAGDAEVVTVNAAEIDKQIARLDEILSTQMDMILHHEDFQKVESAWRSLDHLVQNCDFKRPIKIEVLDVPQEELLQDFEAGPELEQTGLFQKVYWDAFDRVGGHPYTNMVSTYKFGKHPNDFKLLRHLGSLAAYTQCPFLGAVGLEFFGAKNFDEVMRNPDLKGHLETPEYFAWNSFRNDEISRYVGLTLPSFIGRFPYGPETNPTKNFVYKEKTVDGQNDHSLWCSAAFAMAANMAKSFAQWGWSTKIVGIDSGGKVENLVTYTYDVGGEQNVKIPLEAAVGLNKEKLLSDLGFIPLAYWEKTDYACFFGANSAQRPKDFGPKNKAETANYEVGTRLQYTMLVSRIAHYLKYKQLYHVGKNSTRAKIELDLQEWLDSLVVDMTDPGEDLIAKKPLRSATVTVNELPEKPGYFQVEISIKPHFAIVGMDIALSLVAYHKEEQSGMMK